MLLKAKDSGIRFLKHIERNAVLLLSWFRLTARILKKNTRSFSSELEKFNPELLLYKDRILALTKADMIDEELEEGNARAELDLDIPYLFISSVSGKNIDSLKDQLWKILNSADFSGNRTKMLVLRNGILVVSFLKIYLITNRFKSSFW